jgi:hypothetical protein
MFNNIKLRLELRIFLIGIKIIDWLIKDDYEMEFFPDLYEAPLMIFITGWLIEKAQTTGFVGDVFNLIDRKEVLFNKLLKYSTKIQDDW